METGPEYLFNELTKADRRIAELEADCARKDELLLECRDDVSAHAGYMLAESWHTDGQRAELEERFTARMARIDKELGND